MKKYTVAVTGLNATDNPYPGLSVARSLRAEKGVEWRIIALTYDVLCTGIYDTSCIDEVYMIPFPSEPENVLLSRIEEIVRRRKIDVIVPTLDSEIATYSRIAGELRKIGVKTLVASERAVKLRSKSSLWDFCRVNSIPFPKTFILTDRRELKEKVERISLPAVIKASVAGAEKVYSMEEAYVFYDRLAAMWGFPILLQELISGEEYDIVALADKDSELVGTIAIKKIGVTEKGKASAGVTIRNEELLKICRRIVKALKWVGPLELEFVRERSSGKFFLFEVNGRFPTWIYLGSQIGQNLPFATVRLAMGEKVKPFKAYETGKIFMRISEMSVCNMEVPGRLTVRGEVVYRER